MSERAASWARLSAPPSAGERAPAERIEEPARATITEVHRAPTSRNPRAAHAARRW